MRIGQQRTDELGEVFGAFDRAAAALEQRYDPEVAPPATGEGTVVIRTPRPAGTPLASS